MTRRTAAVQVPDQLRLIKALTRLGVEVKQGRVKTADMRKVFGAVMKMPEWIVLHDYPDTVSIPQNLTDYIEAELSTKYRALLPASMKFADFGSYLNREAAPIQICGIVFQYSVENSPRNVCFGYKLFGDSVLIENNGISTAETAKAECLEAARHIIETELYDL